jgi:hypothetical protein
MRVENYHELALWQYVNRITCSKISKQASTDGAVTRVLEKYNSRAGNDADIGMV